MAEAFRRLRILAHPSLGAAGRRTRFSDVDLHVTQEPYVALIDPASLVPPPGPTVSPSVTTVHAGDRSRRERAADGVDEQGADPGRAWQSGQVEPLEIRGWTECSPGNYRIGVLLRNPKTGDSVELSEAVLAVELIR